MVIIHSGDWHISSSRNRLSPKKQDKRERKFLNGLLKRIAKNKDVLLLIAGDITDSSNINEDQREREWDLLLWFFTECEKIDSLINAIVISGNHDHRSRNHTSLNSFAKMRKVKLLKKTHFILKKPEIIDYGHFQMLAVPWFQDLQEVLSGMTLKKNTILLYHKNIHGAKVTNKYTSESSNYLINDPFLKYCAMGDVHLHQHIPNTDNAWYCGSPYPITRGELSGGPRGYSVLDDKDFKPKLIKVKGAYNPKKEKKVEGKDWFEDDGLAEVFEKIKVEDTGSLSVVNSLREAFNSKKEELSKEERVSYEKVLTELTNRCEV